MGVFRRRSIAALTEAATERLLSGFNRDSLKMKIPYGVRNEELWRKHCRKIRARALDLLEGRLGVIETARLMLTLAYWTKVGNEPAFLLFRAIASATDDLPVGTVRAYWAADALAREDARIEAAEKLWREQALAAARMLVSQYQWTIARKRSSADEE